MTQENGKNLGNYENTKFALEYASDEAISLVDSNLEDRATHRVSHVNENAFKPNQGLKRHSKILIKKTGSENWLSTKRDFKQHNHSQSKRVVINVGGVRFETYKSTLKLINESRLANLTPTNSDYDPIRKEYFFDRDPASFQSILNYFRNGKLHAPNAICGNLFYDELNFWGIDERSIQACCWTSYSTKRECDEILKKIMNENEGILIFLSSCLNKLLKANKNSTEIKIHAKLSLMMTCQLKIHTKKMLINMPSSSVKMRIILDTKAALRN
jgi:hypothetical protein